MARIKDTSNTQQVKVSNMRNYMVCKDNTLVQKSRYSLSTQQQKVVLFLISKVKPDDMPYKRYTVSVREFCGICNIDLDSGKNYADVKAAIKGLSDKSIWIKQDNGKDLLFRWLNDVEVDETGGNIEFSFSKYISEHITELHERYTQYNLINVLPMKSKYAIRLYELMKSFVNMEQRITIPLDILKQRLDAETYDNLKDFRRRVIEPAVDEINAFTDIAVKYEFIKINSRACNSVEFLVIPARGKEKDKREYKLWLEMFG